MGVHSPQFSFQSVSSTHYEVLYGIPEHEFVRYFADGHNWGLFVCGAGYPPQEEIQISFGPEGWCTAETLMKEVASEEINNKGRFRSSQSERLIT